MEEFKNIRIGNDISIEWLITRDGRPERFDGKELSVQLLSYQGEEAPITYRIEDNRIIIEFYGKDQSKLGLYTLVLTENNAKVGMSTLDKVRAFRLVRTSEEESGQTSCTQLKVESVKLKSEFVLGHKIYVIDNLNSGSQKDALSANQGRILNEKIVQVEKKIPLKVSDLTNDENFAEKSYVDEGNREQNGKILAEKQRNDTQDSSIKDILEELGTFVKKQVGYGLSQEDFTSALKKKLELLERYDDTDLNKRLVALQGQVNVLANGSESEKIDCVNEIIRFLEGYTDKQNLSTILDELASSGIKAFDATILLEAAEKEPPMNTIPIDFYTELEKAIENKSLIYVKPSPNNKYLLGKTFGNFLKENDLGYTNQTRGDFYSAYNIASSCQKDSLSIIVIFTTAQNALMLFINKQGLDVVKVLSNFDYNYRNSNAKIDIEESIAKKQDQLVSGVNIATINNQDITKRGDIEINEKNIQVPYYSDAEGTLINVSLEEFTKIVSKKIAALEKK